MASIFDVAKYILKTCGTMTTMKLQKLCYYCQAWSLAWDDEPLFEEDFQAWANGPVCPSLFRAHHGAFVVSESWTSLPARDFPFTPSQTETMDIVLKDYGNKSPHWLSELTHQEGPWREARTGVPDGAPSNNIISKESMLMYYGGLLG